MINGASGRVDRRAFLGAAAGWAARGQGRADKRPNILLIMADDLGYETLSVNGGTSYRTPHLDRMAQTGLRFTNAFAQPLCTPTRLQLMTGQLNFRNWRSFGVMDPGEKTFGHMMQQAGYRTAMAGKWQLFSYDAPPSKYRGTGMKPAQSGFDEYLMWHDAYSEDKGSRYAGPVLNRNGRKVPGAEGKYGPDEFSDFLIDFMSRHRDRPFFAYYPMALTHGPFNATPASDDWANGDRLKDDPKYYRDMVEYMDRDLGKVLDALDRLGLAENTLVLYYADNGSPPEVTSRMGERVVPGGKRLTTEAGMHVPMIVRWRGVTPEGKVCGDLVDSTDFLPAICEATGAKWFAGRPLDGRSFLPQVKGQAGRPRQWLFSHYDPHPSCKADVKPTRLAWDQRWKLYMDGRLYDWRADPLEQKPLGLGEGGAAAKAARVKLEKALDQMARVRAPKFNKYEPDGKTAY